MLTKQKVCQRLSTRLSTQKAPIYKGSEGFTYNNTIKIVKLYKKIKVKIIIENIVFVVCCLHWLGVLVADAQWAPLRYYRKQIFTDTFPFRQPFCILHSAFNWVCWWRTPNGRPYGVIYCGFARGSHFAFNCVGLTLPSHCVCHLPFQGRQVLAPLKGELSDRRSA